MAGPAHLLLAAALLAGACGGEEDGMEALPSGSLGVVTPAAADEAVLGLCDLIGATDLTQANATFFDRSHDTLHVIAAATDPVDRPASSALLETKQRVEADLGGETLPEAFGGDVEALLEATRGALDAVGLDARACPA